MIASVLFLFGASQNASGRSSGGMYAGAAVLTVAATALAITSFIMLSSSRRLPGWRRTKAMDHTHRTRNRLQLRIAQLTPHSSRRRWHPPRRPLNHLATCRRVRWASSSSSLLLLLLRKGRDGLSTVVRNEVARQGIRLAAKVVEHSLLLS